MENSENKANGNAAQNLPKTDVPDTAVENVEKEVYDFSWALRQLKAGKFCQRIGWNGKCMYLGIQTPDENSKMTHPYLFMIVPECEEGERKLPWQPAQVDLFANDWSSYDTI
jgi:hypothetical protein